MGSFIGMNLFPSILEAEISTVLSGIGRPSYGERLMRMG